MALFTRIGFKQQTLISHLLRLQRYVPVCRGVHESQACRREAKEITMEPVKFTSSTANTSSKPRPREANKYEGLIVMSSLVAFMFYFFYFREENDLDEMLYKPIPVVEEFHLAQVISEMKMVGADTRQKEAELQELVNQREAREQQKRGTY